MSYLSSETNISAPVYTFELAELCCCCAAICKRHVVKGLTNVSFPQQLRRDIDEVDRARKTPLQKDSMMM